MRILLIVLFVLLVAIALCVIYSMGHVAEVDENDEDY